MSNARTTPPRATSLPTRREAAQHAAEGVTLLAHLLVDCARELEARGGQRMARGQLTTRTVEALTALVDLEHVMPSRYAAELREMYDGAAGHYCRETWALRIVAMATEVGDG
jgi:hypothetical protein